MKISPQISLKLSVILGFSLVAVLVVVLAVVGLVRIAETNQKVEQIVGSNNVKNGLVHRMRDALRERMAVTQLIAHVQDPFRQNDEYLNLVNHGAAFSATRTELEAMPLSPEEKEILDRVRGLAIQAQPFVAEATEQALRGNTAKARQLIEAEVTGAQRLIAAELDELLEVQKREAESVVSDSRKSFEFTRLHMLVLASFAVGLGLMIAPVVIRRANKQADTLQQQAMFDGLTDLPNRLLLADRMRQAVLTARHEQRTFGLFVIDIDRFGEINRTFGDTVGDQVIRYVATCIQACLNEPDTLARLDGDEFALLSMAVNDVEDAIALVLRIRESVSEPIEISGHTLQITASIGVVMFPHHGETPEALMHAADAALRVAKQTPRGYRIFSADMAEGTEDRLALIHELRQAIPNNELTLHYQPKIDFNGDRLSGVEALVRWAHPTNGLMSPEQFIPLAEQIGLIVPLTDWVLDTAMRQYQEWYQTGLRLPMSVKVTAASIQDPGFPDQMAERIVNFDVPATQFEIEVKDTAAITERAVTVECMRRLNSMGFQIAVGDFGTGDSAMLVVTERLVANHKIDTALVKGMAADRGGTMRVRTAVNLGHTLGLKVVAKGVETQDFWDTLRDFGCDSAQGYYTGRPLPPVELVDWLHTSPWSAMAENA